MPSTMTKKRADLTRRKDLRALWHSGDRLASLARTSVDTGAVPLSILREHVSRVNDAMSRLLECESCNAVGAWNRHPLPGKETVALCPECGEREYGKPEPDDRDLDGEERNSGCEIDRSAS